ncbi:MAG: M23 family metallopeptidase [Chloroflexota bacterium]
MLEWRRGRKRIRPHRTSAGSGYDYSLGRTANYRRRDFDRRWVEDGDEGSLINWRRMFWQTLAAAAIFVIVLAVNRAEWAPAKAAMSGIRYGVASDFDWRGLYERVQAVAVWHPLGGNTVNPPGDTGSGGGAGTPARSVAIKLTAPLPGAVTLPYGLYMDGTEQRFHTGLDIDAAEGDPIFAAAAGKVKSVARNATYGLYLEIDHGDGVVTLYAHCSQVVVKPKDSVSAGQKVAEAGHTGNASGAHLHFEVLVDGQAVDPAVLISAR